MPYLQPQCVSLGVCVLQICRPVVLMHPVSLPPAPQKNRPKQTIVWRFRPQQFYSADYGQALYARTDETPVRIFVVRFFLSFV